MLLTFSNGLMNRSTSGYRGTSVCRGTGDVIDVCAVCLTSMCPGTNDFIGSGVLGLAAAPAVPMKLTLAVGIVASSCSSNFEFDFDDFSMFLRFSNGPLVSRSLSVSVGFLLPVPPPVEILNWRPTFRVGGTEDTDCRRPKPEVCDEMLNITDALLITAGVQNLPRGFRLPCRLNSRD